MRTPFLAFLLIAIAILITIIAPQQQVSAATASFDCSTTGSVTITGGIYPDGIQVVNVGSSTTNCTVNINTVVTSYISFPDPSGVAGAGTTISLSNVAFNATGVNSPFSGVSSAVNFDGPINRIASLSIVKSNWNIPTTPGITEPSGGFAFLNFDSSSSANTFAPGGQLVVDGNRWNCIGYNRAQFVRIAGSLSGLSVFAVWSNSIVATPSNAGAGPGPQYAFDFITLGGDVASTTSISLRGNNVSATGLKATTFVSAFLSCRGTVVGTSFDIRNNKFYTGAASISAEFAGYLVKFEKSVSLGVAALTAPLLYIANNNIQFQGVGAAGSIFETVLINCKDIVRGPASLGASSVGGSNGVTTGTLAPDFIVLYSNNIELDAVGADVIVSILFFGKGLISLPSPVNVSGNTLATNFVAVYSDARWINLQGPVNMTITSPSFARTDTGILLNFNDWFENRAGGSAANAAFITFAGTTGSDVTLHAISIANCLRHGVMNVSAATGKVLVAWLRIENGAGNVGLGSVTFIGNSNFPYVVASTSTQVYISLQVDVTIYGALTLSQNNLGSTIVNASAVFAIMSAAGLSVQGTAIVTSNSIDVVRSSCGSQSCPGAPPQDAKALHASILTFNGNSVAFSSEQGAVLTGNKIDITSTDIGVDGAGAVQSDISSAGFTNGVALLSVTSLLFAGPLSVSNNRITTLFAAPGQFSGIPNSNGADVTQMKFSHFPISMLRFYDVPGLTYNFRSTALTLDSNTITAQCAPCIASSVIFNVSGVAANVLVDLISVKNTLVVITAPKQLAPPNSYDASGSQTSAYLFASQLQLCLPYNGQVVPNCLNPINVQPNLDVISRLEFDNTNTTIDYRPALLFDSSSSSSSVLLPAGFTRASFQVALIVAANNSFPSGPIVQAGVKILKNNAFDLLSGDAALVPGSSEWLTQVTQPGFALPMSGLGNSDVNGKVGTLNYNIILIQFDCPNYLGANGTVMFGLLGLHFQDLCLYSTTTTMAPPTTSSTTFTTTTAPSTTTTSISTSSAASTTTSMPSSTTTSAPTTTSSSSSAASTTTTGSSSSSTTTSTTTTTTPSVVTSTTTATTAMSTTTVSPPPPPTTTTTNAVATATTTPGNNGNAGESTGNNTNSGDGNGGGISTGAVIGICIGGVVFIAAITVSVWYKYGRRSRGGVDSRSALLDDTVQNYNDIHDDDGQKTEMAKTDDNLFRAQAAASQERHHLSQPALSQERHLM